MMIAAPDVFILEFKPKKKQNFFCFLIILNNPIKSFEQLMPLLCPQEAERWGARGQGQGIQRHLKCLVTPCPFCFINYPLLHQFHFDGQQERLTPPFVVVGVGMVKPIGVFICLCVSFNFKSKQIPATQLLIFVLPNR